MGVVRLNEILDIGLGVLDIEDTYDLCKSAEGDTYYLRLRVRRTGFVTALEDSNNFFSLLLLAPNTIFFVYADFREKRELARKNHWRVNSAWHEKARNYRGHNCRAAWSLLGYVPHYRSFNTSRRVSGIDSMLRGEGVSLGSATTAVPSSAAVTVAIPTRRLIESGHQAPTFPVAEPDRTSGAEPRPSRRKRLVASSSSESSASPNSEEEEEGEMLRQRRQRYAAEDMSASAFGDIEGEVRDPLQAMAAMPPAVAGGTPGPDAETVRAAATEATQSAAAEVASTLPPATIVVDDLPPDYAARAGGRSHSAEVTEGRRPEKRARVEASPGPFSPPLTGGMISPPPLAPWRPAIEEVLGRQLTETDHATDPQVVATLGRACALPQDMARWAGMDNESLLLSSMCSLVSLLQKCQMGIERLDAAEAREVEWVVDREELRASLAAKDAMLVEEVGRNAGLVFDLEESQVGVERLRDELKDEETQNLHLASELDDLRTVVGRLEEDLRNVKGTNKRLLSERNQAQGSLEMALRGKAAEIESALAKQEARLKEEFLAEHDSIMGEEVGKLSADYKAQLPAIRDRAWELRWKAALKKAGVPEDSPLLRNPLRFPRLFSELVAVSRASPCVPPQACPEASAAPEAPPAASANLEGPSRSRRS
ncbi:hypothetical protein MRB53_013854 [Persea americana]|uniref:Uncharacterized protein n=1 Tax=Persea americana TaxID=3435 RepID=A0ACC2K9T6_PERAE|nr:hypothetical protein MRB53_013854 [Persea americana]